MNPNARSFKMLSMVRQNKDNESMAILKPQNNPELGVPVQPQSTELSHAIQNLQRECCRSEEVLKEFNDSNALEAFIDIDCLTDVTFIKEEQAIDSEINAALENKWEVNNNPSASLCDYFDNGVQNENVSDENRIESGSSSEEELHNVSDYEDWVTSEGSSADEEDVQENESEHSGEVDEPRHEQLAPENIKRKRSKNRLSDTRI